MRSSVPRYPRPPLKSSRIHYVCTDNQKALLQNFAAREHLTASEVIRQAVHAFIKASQ